MSAPDLHDDIKHQSYYDAEFSTGHAELRQQCSNATNTRAPHGVTNEPYTKENKGEAASLSRRTQEKNEQDIDWRVCSLEE